MFIHKGVCTIVFYDGWDVFITIGGGATEAAFPTLNGIGGIGNPISLWRAGKPGGTIDQGIGAVLKPLTPHLNEIRNLLGEDPWKDSGVIPPARRDPLVLDLNRDGKVELKNAAFLT